MKVKHFFAEIGGVRTGRYCIQRVALAPGKKLSSLGNIGVPSFLTLEREVVDRF
jgi:hypothetical protein